MILTVQMTGMSELALKARYMIEAARAGLKFSVPDGAQVIAEEAKAIVPVLSGNLRDHIKVELSNSGFPGCVDTPERQVCVVTPVEIAENEYGFDPPYARRIEQGFMGTDKLGRTYHQAAQPYMRPAADTKHDEAVQLIKDGTFESLAAAGGFTRGRG